MPPPDPTPVVSSLPSRHDRWVVGFDGSAGACDALAWAVAHAPGRTNRLDFVTAWQLPPSSSAVTLTDSAAAIRAAAERDAECALHTARRELAAHPTVTPTSSCVHGGASAALLDEARAADLLIVGTRGHGGFTHLLVGSTSNQCATHATVPTVVVRPPAKPLPATESRPARVLVGVDGSENSLAALKWAIDFTPRGSEVQVVLAWDVAPLAVGADQFFFPEAAKLARDGLRRLIDGLQPAASSAEVLLTSAFVEGRPRPTLDEYSEGTDLLVVGARGHGAMGSALLGSVSRWLIHHTDRTLAIVPTV